MSKKNKTQLLENASDVYKCYRKQSDTCQYRQLFLNDSSGNVCLNDVTHDRHDEFVESILKHDNFRKKFSFKYIAKEIKPLLIAHINKVSDKDLLDDIDKMISELEDYDNPSIVYLVPFGIQMMDIDQLQIGQILIKKLSDENIDQFCASILKKSNSKNRKTKVEQIKNDFCNGVFIEFSTNAETTKAIESAEEESYKAFDLLGLSILLFDQKREKVAVGLAGDVLYASRSTYVIGQSTGYTDNMKAIGTYDLKITDDFVSKMTQCGIMELSQNLRDGNLSPFKQILLRSIHWFASAHYQPEQANAILNLITSLETLLTPEKGRSIQNAIAEGVAFFNATTLEARKSLKKKVKRFYGIRCGLTHGGGKKVTSNDIFTLSDIVGTLIRNMLQRRNEFTNQQDILNWITEQKFTTP